MRWTICWPLDDLLAGLDDLLRAGWLAGLDDLLAGLDDLLQAGGDRLAG